MRKALAKQEQRPKAATAATTLYPKPKSSNSSARVKHQGVGLDKRGVSSSSRSRWEGLRGSSRSSKEWWKHAGV